MNVNGITNGISAYQAAAKTQPKKGTDDTIKKTDVPTTDGKGVVLELSEEGKKVYTPNTALVNQLKADQAKFHENFRSMVLDMMSKQGGVYGQANDIWKFLASGDFTVDPQTKLEAQQAISEDGYWGVKQTSQRIFDFANALTGGDPEKMAEMKDAFLEGFEKAKEMWGGELPDISQKTYDAVLAKFDEVLKTTDEAMA